MLLRRLFNSTRAANTTRKTIKYNVPAPQEQHKTFTAFTVFTNQHRLHLFPQSKCASEPAAADKPTSSRNPVLDTDMDMDTAMDRDTALPLPRLAELF